MNIFDTQEESGEVSFKFKGTEKEAAQLRKNLMTQIKCHTLHEITFLKNTSSFTNENIAHRLGMLSISVSDEYNFNLNLNLDNVSHHGELHIKGPYMVSNNDIIYKEPNITNIHPNTCILYLCENEEIECQMKIKSGTGKEHQKWNVVHGVRFTHVQDDVWQFAFGLTGQLRLDDILKFLNNV